MFFAAVVRRVVSICIVLVIPCRYVIVLMARGQLTGSDSQSCVLMGSRQPLTCPASGRLRFQRLFPQRDFTRLSLT